VVVLRCDLTITVRPILTVTCMLRHILPMIQLNELDLFSLCHSELLVSMNSVEFNICVRSVR